MSRSTVTSMMMPVGVGLASALLGVLMIASGGVSPMRMVLAVLLVGAGMAVGLAGALESKRSIFRASAAENKGTRATRSKSRLNPVAQPAARPEGKRLVVMPPIGRSPDEDSRIFGGGDFLTPTLGEMTGSFTPLVRRSGAVPGHLAFVRSMVAGHAQPVPSGGACPVSPGGRG